MVEVIPTGHLPGCMLLHMDQCDLHSSRTSECCQYFHDV